MGHHVHRADTEHGPVHVVTEEHVVHIMILFLAIEEDLFLAALFQIFARRNKKAGGAAGRVADHVVGFGVHQLHHHADDVARRAELAVQAGLADLAEQVFVSIAAHIRRLRSAHQTVNFVQRVHDLGEQQRRRQLENGIVHVLGIGAVFIAVQILDEGEYRFLHNGIHLRGREVVEHAPLELAAIHGALTDLYLIGEDALIRQTQHGRLLCPAVVGIVKVVDEHQIGDLLDHIQRVDKAARRENVPKTVDFVFQLTGDHFFFSLAFCIVKYQAIYAAILYFDSRRNANKQLVCFSLARQNSSRRREMRIISRGW